MLYIYYTQQHMVEEYASDISTLQNLQITKNQILDNAIAKHQQRMKQDTGQLSDQDSKKIEDLLYGDGWVDNLNQRKSNSGATRAGDYGYSDIVAQIASLKSSIKSKSSSVSNFTKQLSAFITTVEKEYNPIRNEYAKAVVDKFVKNNRVAVALSDQRMTEMKGTCFLQQVKMLQETCSRVLITGVLVSDMFLEAINVAEVLRCLAKPWTRPQLLNVIADAYKTFEIKLANEEAHQALLEVNQQLVEENEQLRSVAVQS